MNDQRGRRLNAAARFDQSCSKLSAVRDELIHERVTDIHMKRDRLKARARITGIALEWV
jgi:hypothetical protein